MAPNDPAGEFTEVRHRRSSGSMRAIQSGQGRKSNSTQRMRPAFHRRTSVSSGATAPSTGHIECGRGTNRRPSTGSSTSDESLDASEDPDEHVTEKLAIDLGEEALGTGLVLEMLILEALVNNPEMALFKTHGGLSQLSFTHPEGDLFAWLNITRQWVAQLQNGQVEAWYQQHHIQESTLRHVERHVERRRKFLTVKTGRRISLGFGKDSEVSNELISNMILNKFNDNICVYHGHPSLGYKVLSTGETVFIHPSSSVCFLTKYPTYIMFVDIPNNKTKHARAIMVLNDALVMSLLDFNSVGRDINAIIKENVVKPCKFDNVGESIASELEKIWSGVLPGDESFEEILKFQCNNTPLLFERNLKANKVTVYSLPEYHRTIRRMVEDEIKKIQNKFKDECFEIGFPDEKSNLRLLMGPGATNEKFLFAHDFRSVWIHETKEGVLSKEFVMTEMEKYGSVVEVHVSDKATKEDSGIWGTVTFRDPDTVIKLLASSKSQDAAMLIELAPNTCNKLQLTKPKVVVDRTVKLQVKLCRRPVKSGMAYATIKGKRDFGILLSTKNMTIGKDRVKISTRVGTTEDIQITGLCPVVEDGDISNAIIEKLGIIPSSVEIDRQPPFSSTAGDLHKFKTSLQRLVDKAVDVSKVSIRVFMPSPDDLYLKAELKFQTRRIAESAMDFINGAKIRGLPIEISRNPLSDPEVPTVSIRVNDNVYQSVKNEIKKQLSKIPRHVEVKVSNGEDYQELKIYSQNTIEAEGVATRLESFLSPVELRLSRKKVEFLSKEGESFLNTAMVKTKTFIDLVRESRTVSIYGTKSHGFKAKNIILDNIDQMTEITGQGCGGMFRICLQGPNKPPNLMIEVMKDLEGLIERTGVTNLKVDIQGKALWYSGSDEKHFAMQAMIESMSDLAMCTSMMIPKEPLEPEQDEIRECSACYCPIEGSHYSLQACGHHYCEECIDTRIRVSLENKGFPITCVDESCGQSVCVRDIIILSRKLDRGLWKVLKTSADHYVQTRPKEFGFCYKPDCHGLIHKRPNVIAYCCAVCNTKVCPRCLNNYHGSESCEDYLNNTAFKQWMSGSQDRKKCPNCSMAIEKIDGCNRIQCTNCQRHICWKCLEHFADMRLAYDHLNREHDGYM